LSFVGVGVRFLFDGVGYEGMGGVNMKRECGFGN